MTRRLNTFVLVHNSDGVTSKAYGPDDVIPAEVAKLITNPKVWADGPPAESVTEATTTAPPAPEVPPVTEAPPRAGKGSSAPAWLAYATHLGLTVPDGASKAAIIALVDAHTSTPDGYDGPAKDADVAEWRTYADSKGFETDEDVTVAEILAVLVAENIPTE